MIQKFRFGTPIPTDATVEELPIIQVTEDNLKAASSKKKDCLSDADLGGLTKFFHISLENGFSLSLTMADTDAVYGLGQANRGINKRGYKYISCCTDDPNHTEEKVSFYGAHNFVMLIGKESFGLFIDYPADVCFDIGYTKQNELTISTEGTDLDLYLITCAKNSDNPENTVSSKKDALCITGEFRRLIGQSYIPPLWAFGYIQSRWGYMNEKDIRRVAKNYRDNHLPLDSISMDIDYMEDYKDFTVHPERFPSLSALSAEMSDQGLHFIPIIDAGVKIEKGYDVYEDGVKNNYFCKREDGTDFVAGVWPGKTHFPDFLNADARRWFGDLYKRLTDQGIEGFWNDMNEPAIFFSEEGLDEAAKKVEELLKVKDNPNLDDFWAMQSVFNINNDHADYKRFYHNINGKKIRHDKVHNLYGFNMTRAAAEAFDRIYPDKRLLLFSRSSYIGMHRFGGIWTPLMRNHAALGTREQECYQFEGLDDFREILKLRYRLIPYIYSEFVKAALDNSLLFSPLAFSWAQNKIVSGRTVYLPEDMLFVKFTSATEYSTEPMKAGWHYITCALSEVCFFIRTDHLLPLCPPCECTRDLNYSNFELLGEAGKGLSYELYTDDGYTKDFAHKENYLKLEL